MFHRYYESGYDTALAGAFSCDVPALTTLWRKAQRTLYVNMRDSWMDCPDRERSQWTFDVAMDVHQAFYGLGTEAHQLSRKWIRELTAWQKVDASSPAYEPAYAPFSLYAPVPGHWVDELPNQSLQSIAYGFWTYFTHTGDVATMREMLPAVVRYLLSYTVSSTPGIPGGGLVVPRACPGQPHAADVQCSGIWDWCDGQSTNCDYAPIDNAWYFWAINSTLQIARAVNATRPGGEATPAELAELSQRRDALRNGFATFWDPECGCYRSQAHRDRPGGTTTCATKADNCTLPDDRVNGLAVVTGLAPAARWASIARNVLDLSSTTAVAFGSTAMEKFTLEAMFLAGEHDAALARMQHRFGPMIRSKLSTLWEHWDVDPATGAPFAGYNHGWSGGALVLLSKYVAGLSPTTPGWSTFDVRPELGTTLRKASATVATVHGTITVEVERHGSAKVVVRAEVPRGTVARLKLSAALVGPGARITIYPAGAPTAAAATSAGATGADAVTPSGLRLPPGSWAIEAGSV